MRTPTELSDRSLGWLRYLHRKAHTPDDWNREGRPHPHWDDRSDPPMASWPRFDLTDSSYAMALMAQTTPAWREPYVAVLDQLMRVGKISWVFECPINHIMLSRKSEAYRKNKLRFFNVR